MIHLTFVRSVCTTQYFFINTRYLTVQIILSEALKKHPKFWKLQSFLYFGQWSFDNLFKILFLSVFLFLSLLLFSLLLRLLLLVDPVVEEYLGVVEGGPDRGKTVKQLLRLGDGGHALL